MSRPPGRHAQRRGRAVRAPREIYESPATAFVAEFLGVANLFDVEFDHSGVCVVAGQPIRIDGGQAPGLGRIVVRPERVHLVGAGPDILHSNTLPGIVRDRVYVGALSQLEITLDDGSVLQVVLANDGRPVPAPGEPVTASLPPDAIRVLTG